MPVAFGNVSVAKCLLEVGLEGGAWCASYSGKAKVVRTVCHNHRAVLNVLEEQSEELQYWRKVSFVVEDLVGRAVRGEGWRFRASSQESLSQIAPSTPTSGHRSNPCNHDWLLAKESEGFRSSKAYAQGQVSPRPKQWLIPQQPRTGQRHTPRPQGTVVGMTMAEIVQSRFPYLVIRGHQQKLLYCS